MTETTYIGVAGAETDYGPCRDSIELIERGPNDSLWYGRGTKGYEVRQRHINRFIESDHTWLLLLDADMVFAPDTLGRLRSHCLLYTSVAPQPALWQVYLQRRREALIMELRALERALGMPQSIPERRR